MLYLLILVGKPAPAICTFCVWCMIYISSAIISNWLIETYIKDFWYNDGCNTKHIAKIYALAIGSDVLPIFGVCCFCCVYKAFTHDRKDTLPNDDGLGAHERIINDDIDEEIEV